MNLRNILSVLTQNAGLKFISLSASLLIWVWVQTQHTEQDRIRSKVEYKLPDNLIFLHQPSQTIMVTLKAPKGVIRQLKDTELKANIDLSTHNTGPFEFSPKDIVNLPQSVKVVQFSPPTVNISLDERLTRTLKVEPNVSGEPLRGWKFIETHVVPKEVTITGAKTVLSNMASVRTMGISLSKRSNSETVSISLEKMHHSFSIAEQKPVRVELILKKEVIEKEYKNVSVVVPEGWMAIPNQTNITIEGPLLEIEELKSKKLKLVWKESEDENDTIDQVKLYDGENLLPYSFQILQKSEYIKEPTP